MFLFRKNNQKGVSIYFVLMILMIIFGSFLIVSNLILTRFKIIGTVGDSVTAFYAADAGMEKVLYDIKLSGENEFPSALPASSGALSDLASYLTTLKCR